MAFKYPSFGSLARPTKSSIFGAFPRFSWDDITDKEEIGRGSFGCVFTAKRRDGEIVVVKKLLRQNDRGKGFKYYVLDYKSVIGYFEKHGFLP